MITGASRGFGGEIAKIVLTTGGNLIAMARNKQALEYLGRGENVVAITMDVTDELRVKAGVEVALARFGRIDVLVNNAGFGVMGAVEETSNEEVERVFCTNVCGLLNVTRAVLPRMRELGSPAKLAQAVLELASAPNPPLRLPLGKDALERIAAKHARGAGNRRLAHPG